MRHARPAEACPDTTSWDFTRWREVAQAVNGRQGSLSLVVTFDATNPGRELQGYGWPLAFGPRRPRDEVPAGARVREGFPAPPAFARARARGAIGS
jgi:hypothetical protein